MYRLISATPSPYARKVRIQLAEKRIPFELVTEVPWNNDTQTPQFNPLEKLPILICESGETVYESRFVNEWVEFQHPDPPLMPKEKDSILLTKRFEILADGVCDACVLVFWEVQDRLGRGVKNGCRVSCASAMVACKKFRACLAKSLSAWTIDLRLRTSPLGVFWDGLRCV